MSYGIHDIFDSHTLRELFINILVIVLSRRNWRDAEPGHTSTYFLMNVPLETTEIFIMNILRNGRFTLSPPLNLSHRLFDCTFPNLSGRRNVSPVGCSWRFNCRFTINAISITVTHFYLKQMFPESMSPFITLHVYFRFHSTWRSVVAFLCATRYNSVSSTICSARRHQLIC